MGIKVDPSKAVVAAVSYVDAGYAASWLEVQVLAEATFPDVLAVEVVTPTDLTTLAFTKALADATTGFADAARRSFTKARADSISMVDMVDIEVFIQKLLADSQALADAARRSFTKALTDTTNGFAEVISRSFIKALSDATSGFTDSKRISFTKAADDSVELVDTVDIEYWIEKLLADSADAEDAIDLAVAKLLADSASAPDASSYEFDKALADLLDEPVDALSSLDVEKVLDDSAELTDETLVTLIFIRDVDDLLESADDSLLEISLLKTETLEATDSSEWSVAKGSAENLNLIDNMDGDLEYAFIKLVGELLSTSDGQVIDFATQSSDNVLTSSSGVLTMQDYCDITYFLEDYVGTSRTFT